MYISYIHLIGITSGDSKACDAPGAAGPQHCAGEKKQKNKRDKLCSTRLTKNLLQDVLAKTDLLLILTDGRTLSVLYKTSHMNKHD